MLKKLKAVFNGVICLCVFFGGALSAQAVETLPPGMVIGDSDGIYATSEGEYYVDLVNILPGDKFEKEITIRSLDLEEPFSLGLLVEEIDSTGSVDWKDHITMTLSLDGEEIYHGPILGDDSRDWTVTPLELGVCKYGTDKLLTAAFAVDSSLTNEDLRERSTLNFYWTFVATKDQPTEPTRPTEPTEPTQPTTPSEPIAPTDPAEPGGPAEPGNPTQAGTAGAPKQGAAPKANGNKLYPQTGEELVYTFMSGLLLVLIVLFLWKKRREEEQG